MSTYAAAHGSFSIPTTMSAMQLTAFHPRSLAAKDHNLLPGSFLGFILLTTALRWVGAAGPYIGTVFIFGLALYCWFRIARRYWEIPWAVLSTVGVATMPVIARHLALPYTQPILGLSFLITSSWALLRYQEKQTWGRAACVGFLYGVVVFIRPIDAIFTAPLIMVAMVVHRGHRLKMLLTGTVIALVQVPWIYAGYETFGSFLASGYTQQGIGLTNASGTGLAWWTIFTRPPSGEWNWHWIRSAIEYLLLLYPGWSMLAVAGACIYLRRKLVSWAKILKIGTVIAFLGYYVAYYGAWQLYPNDLAARIGSAASYARYWMPLYVGMVAGAVVFLRRMTISRRWVGYVCLVSLVAINTWDFWAHPSGYAATIRRDAVAADVVKSVQDATEPDSLLLAGQDEKYFVGERLTSFSIPTGDTSWSTLASIAHERPVYMLANEAFFQSVKTRAALAMANLEAQEFLQTTDGPWWKLTPRP